MLFTHPRRTNAHLFSSDDLDAINIYMLLRDQLNGVDTGTPINEFDVETLTIELAETLLKYGSNDIKNHDTAARELRTAFEKLKHYREAEYEFEELLSPLRIGYKVIFLVLSETAEYLEQELDGDFLDLHQEILDLILED